MQKLNWTGSYYKQFQECYRFGLLKRVETDGFTEFECPQFKGKCCKPTCEAGYGIKKGKK